MVLNGFQVNRFPCNQKNMQYGLFGHKYSSSQSMVNEPQVLILLLFLVKSEVMHRLRMLIIVWTMS